ncbi:MAG TPA: 2-amino-4-hydroxy-6-hydroxymethyldihydropteridine diphosphokinase [Streptosporangiaceae bacterium]
MTGARTVVLALGSNIGDRLGYLQHGVSALCGDGAGPDDGLACLAVSSVYQSAPVGGPPQDDYLNAVLLASSSLRADQILTRAAAAETAADRARTVRWGPRTLDVDVIACGAETSDDPRLTLPHPRAHERAFVLAPWLEVAPGAVLPGWGPVASLLGQADRSGLRRLTELRLTLPGGCGSPR